MGPRKASCSCGQLGVTCEGEPVRISVCHCYDCQRRSGSAFAVQARFPADAVTIRGSSTTYSRSGEDGSTTDFHFCPTCGATVYYLKPGFVVVPVGAFADRDFPEPRVTVYEVRQHPWVRIETRGELERY